VVSDLIEYYETLIDKSLVHVTDLTCLTTKHIINDLASYFSVCHKLLFYVFSVFLYICVFIPLGLVA